MIVLASRSKHVVSYVLSSILPWSRKSHTLVSPILVCFVIAFSNLCFGVQKNWAMNYEVVGDSFP